MAITINGKVKSTKPRSAVHSVHLIRERILLGAFNKMPINVYLFLDRGMGNSYKVDKLVIRASQFQVDSWNDCLPGIISSVVTPVVRK